MYYKLQLFLKFIYLNFFKLLCWTELCKSNNGHISNSKLCYVPVTNVYISYKAAEKYCNNIGGTIACLKKMDPSLAEFIRGVMWPSYLTSLWVDGIVQVKELNIFLNAITYY